MSGGDLKQHAAAVVNQILIWARVKCIFKLSMTFFPPELDHSIQYPICTLQWQCQKHVPCITYIIIYSSSPPQSWNMQIFLFRQYVTINLEYSCFHRLYSLCIFPKTIFVFITCHFPLKNDMFCEKWKQTFKTGLAELWKLDSTQFFHVHLERAK